MSKKNLVLLLILINCLFCKCGESAREECESKNAGAINVPVYVLYLYGSVMLLLVLFLILLVFSLVFVLVKMRFFDIFHKGKYSTKLVEKNTNTSSRPEVKSMKQMNLDRSNSFEFTAKDEDNLSSRANDGHGTLKSIISEAPHRSPTRTESSGNLSPRIIKGGVKDMPIILPEQMSEICKAVLTRASKNENAGGSLQNIDQLVKETLDDQAEKKCASAHSLDLYDVPPSTMNIKKSKDDSGTNGQNNETNTTLQTKLVSSEDKKQLQCGEIYDLPKERCNTMQTNYVEPYFSRTKADENNCNLKQENNLKTPYAVLSKLKDKNKSSGFKDDIPSDHYDILATPDMERKLYINANENLFKC